MTKTTGKRGGAVTAEAEELRERARKLRELATDVEQLLSGEGKPCSYVINSMESWQGPNRDEVAGQLETYNTECSTVAGNLRSLAQSLDTQADEAEEDEE
jgi:dTDP-4-amino-4,6-dideoxygalactose transaminase